MQVGFDHDNSLHKTILRALLPERPPPGDEVAPQGGAEIPRGIVPRPDEGLRKPRSRGTTESHAVGGKAWQPPVAGYGEPLWRSSAQAGLLESVRAMRQALAAAQSWPSSSESAPPVGVRCSPRPSPTPPPSPAPVAEVDAGDGCSSRASPTPPPSPAPVDEADAGDGCSSRASPTPPPSPAPVAGADAGDGCPFDCLPA